MGKQARVSCVPTVRGEPPSPKGSQISAQGEAPGQEVRKTRALSSRLAGCPQRPPGRPVRICLELDEGPVSREILNGDSVTPMT